MPVYQLLVGAHSQHPYKKIIYASHHLYRVNNYEGCCRGRNMGFYAGPLGVGEVGRVRLSHTC